MKRLLRNPIFIWLLNILRTYYLLFKNKGKHLKICHNAVVKNTVFDEYVTINSNAKVFNSMIGSYSYVGPETIITKTKIGKYCSIGSYCKIGLGKHPTNFVSTCPMFYSTKKQNQITLINEDLFQESERITIGNDVWIGCSVIIQDGVNIADGSIIAAGAIVTKDTEPYSINGGVPSKIIKYRFTKDEIEFLKELEWWNKDISWLSANALKFQDITKLRQGFK